MFAATVGSKGKLCTPARRQHLYTSTCDALVPQLTVHTNIREHEVSNGLLLRRDIHSVFDAGYLTFDEDMRVVVSDRVRTEFNNGKEYRRLQGERLRLPPNPGFQPDAARLRWHRENRFAA